MRNEKLLNVYGDLEYSNTRFLEQDNPWDNWSKMPVYDPDDSCSSAYLTLEVEFEEGADFSEFSKLIGQKVTDRSKSTWYPARIINRYLGKRYICDWYKNGKYKPENYPKYPIYIVSKSRWDIRLTSDSLIELGIKHFIVVEKSQYENYLSKVNPKWVDILILPQSYLDEYDTCDSLGSTKSKGPGAARNFAWDHSVSIGAKRHWVMDDNQDRFFRLNGDKRTPVLSGSIFRAMEDHTDRYENVMISGPNYRFFTVPSKGLPPFVMNSRIYSCLLIRNDIDYRWRGRYNEDTDLSLRVLKDGGCTIQYNAFSTGKVVTQAIPGGNTEAFYAKEGTLPKSQMIQDLHPDVAEIKWMNNRWHHWVNYAPFRSNRLIPNKNAWINPDQEYGMSLEEIELKSGDDCDE